MQGCILRSLEWKQSSEKGSKGVQYAYKSQNGLTDSPKGGISGVAQDDICTSNEATMSSHKGKICSKLLEKDFIFWKQVVISSDKKFNIDGVDGLANYWHGLWKNEKTFSKSQQGGDSLMTCAVISYYDTLGNTVIYGHMGSKQHRTFLKLKLFCLQPRHGEMRGNFKKIVHQCTDLRTVPSGRRTRRLLF